MKNLFLSTVAVFAAATMFYSCKADCKECTHPNEEATIKVCADGSVQICAMGTCIDDTSYNGTQQEMINYLESEGFTCK